MDIEAFKQDLKTIIANNPQPVIFHLRYEYSLETEEFKTKHEFGLKLLEVFKREDLEDIKVSYFKKRHTFGRADILITYILTEKDIERLEFTVCLKGSVKPETSLEDEKAAIEAFLKHKEYKLIN